MTSCDMQFARVGALRRKQIGKRNARGNSAKDAPNVLVREIISTLV